MSAKLAYEVNFELVECCSCSTPFMMQGHLIRRLKATKNSFYCPSCGTSQGWFGQNKEEKLKDELDRSERRLQLEKNRRESAEREAERQSHIARGQKAAKTRLKNRIKNGVCPCCNRTFANLAKHMSGQHPEYQQD